MTPEEREQAKAAGIQATVEEIMERKKNGVRPPRQPSFVIRVPLTARSLCEQAVRGAQAGWVSREVGAFAADILAALDAEAAP